MEVASVQTVDTIAFAQAQERLRQESATFDQRVLQDAHWFRLRLAMGWVAVVLLPTIMVISATVLMSYEKFTPGTVTAATGTLFVDAAGLIFLVWKIVLGTRGPDALKPVTNSSKVSRGKKPKKKASSRRVNRGVDNSDPEKMSELDDKVGKSQLTQRSEPQL